jgi:hypothetical protein
MASVRLRHIGVLSAAIWVSLLAMPFGLMFGIVFAFFAFVESRAAWFYIVRWVVLTPMVFALIAFAATVIGAVIYNSLVRKRGGIVLEFADIKVDVELPPPPPNF